MNSQINPMNLTLRQLRAFVAERHQKRQAT
jgi:hypothetical protein